jgi:hypothetical protein
MTGKVVLKRNLCFSHAIEYEVKNFLILDRIGGRALKTTCFFLGEKEAYDESPRHIQSLDVWQKDERKE